MPRLRRAKHLVQARSPADVFKIALEQVTRLFDLIGVGATLSRDVPIHWQVADVHMLVKSWAASPQSLVNRREILLADQKPKSIGATLRHRLVRTLRNGLVQTHNGAMV